MTKRKPPLFQRTRAELGRKTALIWKKMGQNWRKKEKKIIKNRGSEFNKSWTSILLPLALWLVCETSLSGIMNLMFYECVCVCVCTHTRSFSCVWLFATSWAIAHQASLFMEISSKNTGAVYHSFLQRTFLTQGLHPSLLRLLLWQADSLMLNHLGNPWRCIVNS